MTQTQKINLIDQLNVAFETIQAKYKENDYSAYFNRLTKELETLILTKENVSKKDITNIVNSVNLPSKNVRQLVLTSLVLSGISNVIENQQLPSEDRENFAPIIALVGLYGISATLLSKKTDIITNAFLKRNTKGLGPKELKGHKMLQSYFIKNEKIIKEQVNLYNKNIAKVNKDIKSFTSKKLFNDYRKIIKTTETQDKVSEKLLKKFGAENSARITRIVRTETKRLNEVTKLTQHQFLGYTHKRWNTQQDADVSKSHRVMQGVTIKIDQKFRVPGIDRKPSARLLYPGDPSGPVGQIVNERCFLTYLKR